MESVLFNTIGALLILAVGSGLGYWFGNRHRSADSATASEVQEAFDDYRRNVTEHFGQTANHFQAIGKQYRELYEHMASGAEALCELEDAGSGLSFPKAVAPALSADAQTSDEDAPKPDSEPAPEEARGDDEAMDETRERDAEKQASPDAAADSESPTEDASESDSKASDAADASPSADRTESERKPAADTKQGEERIIH